MVGPQSHRFHRRTDRAVPGQDNNLWARLLALDHLDQLQAVDLGKAQVDECDVEPFTTQEGQGFVTVACDLRLMTEAADELKTQITE